MNISKRLLQISAVILICIVIVFAGYFWRTFSPKADGEANTSSFFPQKTVVSLWYTDETYTDFLDAAAVAYTEAQHEVRVEPRLVAASEYLEEINRASLDGEGPDAYMISNDILEKAYLAGLAVAVPGSAQMGTEHFPQSAINAVTYHGKIVGYPLCFDTCALLYNKTYLEQMEETIPPTNVEEILTFADEHDAPENVESFFSWDVTRILYNFNFASDAMKLGGPSGDQEKEVDIYNVETVQSLQLFGSLSQFFSIDPKEMNYDRVLQDFIDGKLVFTLATTDSIKRLELAKMAGEFPYEYGVTLAPGPTADYVGNAISVTNAIAVNGYSEKKKAAGAFAQYLTQVFADTLYEKTGKLPADRSVNLDKYSGAEGLYGFYNAYEHSTPMPKLMELSNFWVYYEVVLNQVWNGAEVDEQVRQMAQSVMTQLTGEQQEIERINIPAYVSAVEQDGGME